MNYGLESVIMINRDGSTSEINANYQRELSHSDLKSTIIRSEEAPNIIKKITQQIEIT